jgi:hypothetical protein
MSNFHRSISLKIWTHLHAFTHIPSYFYKYLFHLRYWIHVFWFWSLWEWLCLSIAPLLTSSSEHTHFPQKNTKLETIVNPLMHFTFFMTPSSFILKLYHFSSYKSFLITKITIFSFNLLTNLISLLKSGLGSFLSLESQSVEWDKCLVTYSFDSLCIISFMICILVISIQLDLVCKHTSHVFSYHD